MYHILYKTTNNKTGEYYVGVHSTSNLKDGYLGSGKKLVEAVQKHGRTAFSRTILSIHDNRLELQKAEMDYVSQDLLNDPLCLNIELGGGSEFERTLIRSLQKV